MKKLLLLVVLFGSGAHAEIYKWVDKDGTVHYADAKPQDSSIAVEQFLGSSISIDDQGRVVHTGESPAAASPALAARAKPSAAEPPKPFEWTVESVVAYAKKLWREWAGQPAQITPTSAGPSKAIQPVARKPEAPAMGDTAVISNDNMDAILEQIEQERIAKEEAEAARTVEIFTAPWCGYCKKAIAYLEVNKVPYEEYDITADPTAALRQKMLGGGSGVPFAVINGQPISGWSQQAYAQALGK